MKITNRDRFIWLDVRRFAYTIRVDSLTLKSFCLHLSRKYFAKIDEYHCPQGAGESHYTVLPVKVGTHDATSRRDQSHRVNCFKI